MRVGTKSVLYGAHCFFLHPWFVALGWWKLYGFPWDPRLWLAFFVHDLGYWGKPNMDGPEGEEHPEWGARLMARLCDTDMGQHVTFGWWWRFSRYHSRFLAKRDGEQPSRLCWADKLAIALTPSWLYVPMARATGEIFEYMKDYEWVNPGAGSFDDMYQWHANVQEYCRKLALDHADGKEDKVTRARRHSPSGDGVWE